LSLKWLIIVIGLVLHTMYFEAVRRSMVVKIIPTNKNFRNLGIASVNIILLNNMTVFG
jgi:hypothetical protein